MILAIRTDNPEAEVNLFDVQGTALSNYTWHAHRELSNTLLSTIHDQLAALKATFTDITGVVVFKGPGSFTGLRIGITVANTLAYGLNIPIVGGIGDQWQQSGITALLNRQSDRIVLPEYGSDAHITLPKK